MPHLISNRILVRPFKQDDLDSLITMMSDAEVMRYTGFKTPQTRERIQDLLGKWMIEGANSLGVWAVEDVSSKDFVGWVMLKKTTTELPELGYMLPKHQWSKGYATEIASLIIGYAGRDLKLSKVRATTSPDNHHSIRILEKIGMRQSEVGAEGLLIFTIEF
jgi:Acetyltransferases, including N-acetylases of ribosomal proteins